MVNGLPIGCAVYGIRTKALEVVCEIKKEIDTEIWGPLINRPEIFSVKRIEVSESYQWPDLRLTSDYEEDYKLLNRIYADFKYDDIPNLLEVLEYLRVKPDLLEINSMKVQATLSKNTMDRIDLFFKTHLEEIKRKKEEIFTQ